MATIVERDEMVRLLFEEYDALDALCAPLDHAQWATPTCLPGWTVKDVLAHVVGTESLLAGEPLPAIDLAARTDMANEIARTNEIWVESMRPLSGPDVLARFRAITARRRHALAVMTQADFDAPSWTPVSPEETYGRFMRIRHYDCFIHEHDIRAALGLPDRADPAHVASAMTEPETGLGYIVGRRARMPEGTSVALTVTGPLERTWLVTVEGGRARVVPTLGEPPTVLLTCPAMLFLRLTSGRVDPAAHIGADLALGGDPQLAQTLATHLTFTI